MPRTWPVVNSKEKILVGISSCLLGEPVRFNAGHKRDDFIVKSLGRYLEWVPVCPEVELGLGVPRESMHLVKRAKKIHLVTTRSDKDLTGPMETFSEKRVGELRKLDLCGYIFKKGSPSCGMERVKVYGKNHIPDFTGQGIFAGILTGELPNLPTEEEGRLYDPVLRENWVERVFAYHAIQTLWHSKWGMAELINFHTRHKLSLLAHSESHYRRMGRLVANAKKVAKEKTAEVYESEFMAALKVPATRGTNTNVLMHMVGYFTKKMDPPAKRELLSVIDDYQAGIVPLSVPLTLVGHYVRVFEEKYLGAQTFLSPHPKELALRHFI